MKRYAIVIVCRNEAGGLRKAYMGHLIRIGNYVVEFGKQGKNASKIQRLIENLPEDLRNQWFEFVENKVAQANRNNEIIPVTVQQLVFYVNINSFLNFHS